MSADHDPPWARSALYWDGVARRNQLDAAQNKLEATLLLQLAQPAPAGLSAAGLKVRAARRQLAQAQLELAAEQQHAAEYADSRAEQLRREKTTTPGTPCRLSAEKRGGTRTPGAQPASTERSQP